MNTEPPQIQPSPPTRPKRRTRQIAAFFQSMDRSSRAGKFAGLLTVILSTMIIYPLIDRFYYEWAFEPDAWATVNHTMAFMNFIRQGTPAALLPLSNWPPYFDGAFVLQAVCGFLVTPLRDWHWLDPALLSTDRSIAIWTIRNFNMLTYIITPLPLFYIGRSLSRSNLMGIAAAMMVALCPWILDADITRVDFPNNAAYCFLLWASFAIAGGDRRWRTGAMLGLSFALFASMKITAIALSFVPAVAVLLAVTQRRYRWSQLGIALLCFLALAPILFIRYLLHASSLISNILSKIECQAMWKNLISAKPWLYYNWDYFLPYGYMFMILCGLSLVILLTHLTRKRDRRHILLLVILGLLSLMGIPVMKYCRGGYTLVPIYMLLIAAGAGVALTTVRRRFPGQGMGIALAALFLVCLLPALSQVTHHYIQCRTRACKRPESLRITRLEPRQWFKAHVPPHARIATVWHEWAEPPIQDLGFKFKPSFLTPSLDRKGLSKFAPPSFAEMEAGWDIVMVNDFYLWISQDHELRQAGFPHLAEMWPPFWQELAKRYPMKQYTAESPNYCVREITIYVIHPEILLDPANSALSSPH